MCSVSGFASVSYTIALSIDSNVASCRGKL